MGRTFGDVAEDALRWGVNIAVSLADGLIRGATSALVFALDFIANLLTSWLSPGSPPKLLPDLPKWGMGWMAEILKGMTQADFSALEGIQGPLREALSILEQTGQIGKGAAGAILADLSKQLAKGLAGETVDESVFDKIANAAGGFGEEIAELAKRQIALASATDEVRKAEEALEQARKKQIAEQQKVSALTAEYNQLLRQGRSPAVLKAKLAEINAAEVARDLAAEQAKAAQEQVDTGKDRVDVLKEQVALQSDLVRQLIDLTRAQIVQPEQPEAGEEGLGDLGAGVGGALANITDSLGKAVDEAKKVLKEKLADIFAPLLEKLPEWKRIWDTFEIDFLTTWFRLFGPERGIVTTTWNENVQPVIDKIAGMFPDDVLTRILTFYGNALLLAAGLGILRTAVLLLNPQLLLLATGLAAVAVGFDALTHPRDYQGVTDALSGALVGLGTWLDENVRQPLDTFFNETLPNWFATHPVGPTISGWITDAGTWLSGVTDTLLRTYIIDPLGVFFGTTLPAWFADHDIGQAFSDWITEKVATVEQAGRDLIQGFWDGVSAKWTEFTTWLSDQLAKLPEVIKSFFGIDSPSKMMMGLGQDIMAGLAKGLQAGALQPQLAMQQASTAMVPQAAAVPVATGATFSRTLNMNMGGVNVNNGMDQTALVALIRRTIKDSLGV